MQIIRLNYDHWNDIETVYKESLSSELSRHFKKNPEGPLYTVDGLTTRWELWSSAIKKYYLIDDEYHFLYGYYDNKKLLTFLGWRCDLPDSYKKDWVIAWLKGIPSINASTTTLPFLWKKMFELCENRGLNRWHALVKKNRYNKFDAFERKYVPEIHKKYKYETSLDIPAGVKPDLDWVWAMMGRNVLTEDFELRTGTRIKNV